MFIYKKSCIALFIMVAGLFCPGFRCTNAALVQDQAKGAAPAPPKTDRPEDRAAIQAVLDDFTKAFEARDPKAMGNTWTTGGEFTTSSGQTIRGRDALVQAFTTFFSRTPEVKAEVRPTSLRFLASEAAVGEGKVVVQRGVVDPPAEANYSALFVREGGKWLLAEFGESDREEVTIEDLGWLVGEWRSAAGEGAEIRTTYEWSPSKKFIHGRFAIKERDLTLSGSQVIGVDPATGAIHSWTFEADGGVAEADWTPDGGHWVLEAVGTLVDGATLTETNILRRLNDDTFTWQSINRLLDEEPIADLSPVKVSRVKPSH